MALAKKTTAKKTTAKKTTAKKTTAKKTELSQLVVVPEVPIQSTSVRSNEVMKIRDSEFSGAAQFATQDSSVESTSDSKNNKGGFTKIFLLVGILVTAVFVFAQSNNSPSGSVDNPTKSAAETSETTEDELKQNSQTNPNLVSAERIIVESGFIYTPTGIELNWNVSQPSEIVLVEISSQENNGSIVQLGSFGAETKSLELTKNDNEGITSFSVKVKTKSGQQIIAPALDVRGKFSAI